MTQDNIIYLRGYPICPHRHGWWLLSAPQNHLVGLVVNKTTEDDIVEMAWIVHTVRFHVLIISTISDGIRKQYLSGQVQWRMKVQKDTLATMLFSNSGSTMLSSGSIVLLSSSDVSYLVELTKFGFCLFG